MADGHEHDKGLAHDLKLITANMERRKMLRWMAGATLLPWVGCGMEALSSLDAGGGDGGLDGGLGGASDGNVTSCSPIPDEAGGPYPGDGSNGPNALALTGIVRSDIRSSIAGASGVAQGVPLTVALKLVNTKGSCANLAGYAIYLWHCDRDGKYSMYDSAVASQNYLRGVQETASDGTATFTTIFPACYSGRWPHIHFEIYPSLAKASAAGNKLKTSQLALPADVCHTVFATSGYSQSVSNLDRVSLSSDMVFGDGASLQLPTVSGSVAAGYTATLTVGIPV